jgi:hypothetical protein
MAIQTQPQGGLQMAADATQPQQEEAVQAEKPQAAQAATAPDPIQASLERTRQGRELLNRQIEQMQAALQKRTQPTFDPKALRLLQEATRPTATGHFLESLGNMAGGYGQAQEAEVKREQDIMEKQYELAVKKQGLNEQNLEQEAMISQLAKRGLLPPSMVAGASQQAPTAPTQRPLIGGQTLQQNAQQNAQPTEQPSAKPTQYIGGTPPNIPPAGKSRPVSFEDIEIMTALAPTYAKTLKGLSDEYRKGLMVTTEGVYNTWSGTYDAKFDKPVEAQFAYVDGPQKIMSSVYEKYKQLKERLDAGVESGEVSETSAKNLLQRFYAGNGITSQLGAKRNEKQMEADIDVDKSAKIKRSESQEETFKASLKDINAASEAAGSMRTAASSVERLALNPETAGGFGLLSKPGFSNALAALVAKNQKTPLGDIDTSGISDALARIGHGLKQNQGESREAFNERIQTTLDARSVAARNIAVMAIAFSQAFKGQGAVSDRERALVDRITPNIEDSPKIILLKSRAVIARSQFDTERADLLNKYLKVNPQASIEDFKQSGGYKSLKTDYEGYLQQLEKQTFGDIKGK